MLQALLSNSPQNGARGLLTRLQRGYPRALCGLASADGLGPTPAPQSAKIVRQIPGGTQRTEIPVDLRKVQSGKAEDLGMRPNDILVIPPSTPKKALTRAAEAAVQTATGVAIWRIL